MGSWYTVNYELAKQQAEEIKALEEKYKKLEQSAEISWKETGQETGLGLGAYLGLAYATSLPVASAPATLATLVAASNPIFATAALGYLSLGLVGSIIDSTTKNNA